MKKLILLMVFVLLFSTPLLAQDLSIEEIINEIEKIVVITDNNKRLEMYDNLSKKLGVITAEKIDQKDNAIQVIEKNARDQWGTDEKMFNYEVEKQTNAYRWYQSEKKHPDILNEAKNKWEDDYVMVKHEYEKQVSAYKWIEKYDDYPNIMSNAKNKWDSDYAMVKHEYEKQVNAFEWLQTKKNKNIEAFEIAANKWEDDYAMVKYEFEKMIQ